MNSDQDDEHQRALRAVTEEVRALLDARRVGGVVLLVNEEAAAWLHVIPDWAAIERHPLGFRIKLRGSTEAGRQRTEATFHLLGSLRDMASDVHNLFGRLFRMAKSQVEVHGGSVEHKPFDERRGVGGRPDPEGGRGN